MLLFGPEFSQAPVYQVMVKTEPSTVWWGTVTLIMCAPSYLLSYLQECYWVRFARMIAVFMATVFWVSAVHLVWIAFPFNALSPVMVNIALIYTGLFCYHAVRLIVRPMKKAHDEEASDALKRQKSSRCLLDKAEAWQ